MSTALVSGGFYDFGDVLYKNSPSPFSLDRKNPIRRSTSSSNSSTTTPSVPHHHPTLSSLSTVNPIKLAAFQQKLANGLRSIQPQATTPLSTLVSTPLLNGVTPNNALVMQSPTSTQQQQNAAAAVAAAMLSAREHRKLDRSISEPVHPGQINIVVGGLGGGPLSTGSGGQSPTGIQSQQANSSRYKTELCRPFEENGTCKYGDKCQFAHGYHELRTLSRHPKYKTELCRTFHTTGFCPYGPRCHFIHNNEETKKMMGSNSSGGGGGGGSSLHPKGSSSSSSSGGGGGPATRSKSIGGGEPLAELSRQIRPKALSIGSFSLGSAGELSPPSSLSASPTSLNGFFTEDTFYTTSGHFLHPGHHRSLSGAPPTTPNTAFSFSQDFANAVVTPIKANHPQFRVHIMNPGNNNTRGPPLSAPPSTYMSQTAPVSSNADFLSDSVNRDPMFKFPEAPPSPVDSLSSEIEAVNLGANNNNNNNNNQESLSSTNGSDGNPHRRLDRAQASPTQEGSSNILGSPRLPIFSRLSNTSDSE